MNVAAERRDADQERRLQRLPGRHRGVQPAGERQRHAAVRDRRQQHAAVCGSRRRRHRHDAGGHQFRDSPARRASPRSASRARTRPRSASPPGDTFTITVNGGAVSYAKNGGVFYTGATRRAARCARTRSSSTPTARCATSASAAAAAPSRRYAGDDHLAGGIGEPGGVRPGSAVPVRRVRRRRGGRRPLLNAPRAIASDALGRTICRGRFFQGISLRRGVAARSGRGTRSHVTLLTVGDEAEEADHGRPEQQAHRRGRGEDNRAPRPSRWVNPTAAAP